MAKSQREIPFAMKNELTNVRIPVAIFGAGPVGLSLALGLARFGVKTILLERDSSTSEYSKAGGIHLRSREIYRQWGVEDKLLKEGELRSMLLVHNAKPGGKPFISFNFSEIENEADKPGILFLEQGQTEKILLEEVRKTGLCDIRFGAEVVDLSQDKESVKVFVHQSGSAYEVESDFAVGCDGAESFTRNALNLPFEGSTYGIRPMLADIRVEDSRDELPWPRSRNSKDGITSAFRFPTGLWRIISLGHPPLSEDQNIPKEEIQQRVSEVLGNGSFEVIWASRFRIHLRHSPKFRVNRILLAGDAAHIHSPAGGQGMNAGIQDAHNLAWKLAAALNGGEVDRLLNSYESERKAVVVEKVSNFADQITRRFLQAPGILRSASFAILRLALRIGPIRKKQLRRMTMIDLAYPPSPLLRSGKTAAGIRLPNPILRHHQDTETRLYDLLPNGPLIIEISDAQNTGINLPIKHRIRLGMGGYQDTSGLLRRMLKGKDGWILVRPDAHVAWARTTSEGIGDEIKYALGIPLQ